VGTAGVRHQSERIEQTDRLWHRLPPVGWQITDLPKSAKFNVNPTLRVGANGLATIARGTVFRGPPFEGAESSSGFPIENPSREKVSLSSSRLAAVRARETLRSTPNDANTTEFRFPAWVPELVGATPLVRTQAFLLDQPVVFSEECQKKKPGTG
jgi:hypothetical protein